MLKLLSLFKTKRGMTLIEIMLALTTFSMVLGGYWKFMAGQNRQVTTITQRSQADEITTMAIQNISADIKSARSGQIHVNGNFIPAVSITNNGITIYRSFENEDIKKSDKLFVQKVEYTYDSAKKEINKVVTKVNIKEAKKINDIVTPCYLDAEVLKKSTPYKNVTKLAFKKVAAPGLAQDHTLGIGIEVEANMGNILTNQAQISQNHGIIFIKDEVAYKNQPSWNVNPIFTNELVNVSLSPPQTMDFGSALEIIKWAKDFKTLIPEMLNDAKKQIEEAALNAVVARLFDKAGDLYLSLVNDATINGMIESARGTFLDKIKKEPKLLAAAALLNTATFKQGGADLMNRILGKTLSNDEIKNLIKVEAHRFVEVGVISWGELNEFNKFINNEEHASQAAYVAVIDKVKNQIYDALPTQDKVSTMISNYADNVINKMYVSIKTNAIQGIVSNELGKIIEKKSEEVLKTLKENSGVKSVLNDPQINDEGKAILNEILDLLSSGVSKLIGELTTNVTTNIMKNIEQNFQKQEDAYKNALENMPDVVNTTVQLMAKKFLTGEKWDATEKKFIKAADAKSYFDDLYKGFNIPTPSFDSDKYAQDGLDKFYAENKLENPFKK